MKEAFKKNKKCGFFPHGGGGGSGPNKSVEKGCFLGAFWPFLTLFDHKISRNFHTLGEGGLGGEKKIHTFFFIIEGFPNTRLYNKKTFIQNVLSSICDVMCH